MVFAISNELDDHHHNFRAFLLTQNESPYAFSPLIFLRSFSPPQMANTYLLSVSIDCLKRKRGFVIEVSDHS